MIEDIFNIDIPKYIEERNRSIPSKLVKFISLSDDAELNEDKFKTLEDEKLWFSSVLSLNDPYEYSGMYVDKERLLEHKWKSEIVTSFEEMFSGFKKKYALVSLSGNTVDSLPMWAYYTNNYSGYCVEYDVLRPDLIFPVNYREKRMPVATLFAKLYNETGKMIKGDNVDGNKLWVLHEILSYQLKIKHKSWEHEKEYRIIYPIEGEDGVLVPINDIGLKTSRIIAGLNCKQEHIGRLKEISHHLSCGNVCQVSISETDYTLTEEIIDGQNEI